MHLVIALLAAIAARQAHACSFEIASVTSTYLGKPWSNATIANNTYTPQQVVVRTDARDAKMMMMRAWSL